MSFVGADLEVLADVDVCLEGAAPEAKRNGRGVAVGETIGLQSGDRMAVEKISGGARTYLCVRDGLEQLRHPQLSPRLIKGDILRSASPNPPRVSASPRPRVSEDRRSGTSETVVRVVLDPRRLLFSPEGIATFLRSSFQVSRWSDRRGVRFEGTPVALAGTADVPPEGTPLGGIQVARDGVPIVLGPDRPVTGGYARIATVIGSDFPLLAQVRPGDKVRFVEVGLAEALAARVG
jgi:antagonist of KipI